MNWGFNMKSLVECLRNSGVIACLMETTKASAFSVLTAFKKSFLAFNLVHSNDLTLGLH